MKKKNLLIGSLAVLTVVTAAFLLAHAATQAPVYVMDVFVGDVQASVNGGEWKPVDTGMELHESDKVKTGADSYCEIVMPNRGIFRLEQKTEVLLKTLAPGSERIQVRHGGFIANIVNHLTPQENFEVETTTAVVAVRGTRFEVSVGDEEDSTVAVQSGTVTMSPNLDYSEVTNEELAAQMQEDMAVRVSSYESATLTVEQNRQLQEEMVSHIEQMILDAENRSQNMVNSTQNRINNLLNNTENNIENMISSRLNPNDIRDMVNNLRDRVNFSVGGLAGNARIALNTRFESLGDNSVRQRMARAARNRR